MRLLSWLCTIAAGGAAIVMWLNLRGFGDVLDPQVAARLTVAALALSASAVVFLLIALAHLGRRGGPVSARAADGDDGDLARRPRRRRAAGATMRGWPRSRSRRLSVRDGGPPRRPRRSSSRSTVRRSTSSRRPSRKAGCRTSAASSTAARCCTWRRCGRRRPRRSGRRRSTGRAPAANGIRASALYRVRGDDPPLELLPDYCFAQALVRLRPARARRRMTRGSLLARPLWSILSDAGVAVGVIGFPLTHPAPPVQRRAGQRRVSSSAAERSGVRRRRVDLAGVAALSTCARRSTRPAVARSGRARRGGGGGAAGRRRRAARSRRRSSPTACTCSSCRRCVDAPTRGFSPSGCPASMRWGTTSCATRIRRRSATCRRTSSGATGAC